MEVAGRLLQEANSQYGSALVGMLFFTMAVYGVFFIGLAFFCCSPGLGGVAIRDDDPVMMSSGGEKPRVSELPDYVKKAFVRKVYTILGMQIFTTFVIAASMMIFGGRDLVEWVAGEGSWTLMTTIIGSFVSLIAVFCFRQSSPANMILLMIFTLLESCFVGFFCATYAADGLSTVIIEAFAITSIIFVGLTFFTMHSKINFDFLGPMLFVAVLVLMVWSLFMAFFISFESRQIFALVAVIIFSLYIVYDTHMVMNRLSPDEFILGAISLYLDFINVFIYIATLLAGDRR